MRFELRLIAIAALLLIVIVASCRHQSIAATAWVNSSPTASKKAGPTHPPGATVMGGPDACANLNEAIAGSFAEAIHATTSVDRSQFRRAR